MPPYRRGWRRTLSGNSARDQERADSRQQPAGLGWGNRLAARREETLHTDSSTEYVQCAVCGSESSTTVIPANTDLDNLDPEVFACTSPHIGRHGTIVRCDHCGLMFMNPRPTAERIGWLYSQVEDNTYLQEEEARTATFRHSLGGIRRFERSGRLLDIGSHVGTFLMVARDAGYEVAGVEPSGWATEYARSVHGLDVRAGSLAQVGFADESFDIVTLWDVIEHLTDPVAELEQINRVLRPGGLFALTTMNVAALLPRVLGRRWPWYMLMHLYYFTPRTVTALLEKTGFEVVEIGPHIRVTHVRYLVSKTKAYSEAAYRLGSAAARKLGVEDTRVPINLGDLMTVYARKR